MSQRQEMNAAISRIDEEKAWDAEHVHLHTYMASDLLEAVRQGLYSKKDFAACTMSITIMEQEQDGAIYDLGAIVMTTSEHMSGHSGHGRPLCRILEYIFGYEEIISVYVLWDKDLAPSKGRTKLSAANVEATLKLLKERGGRDKLLIKQGFQGFSGSQ